MSFVWKHPSLTALEVLWRWFAAVPLLALAWHLLAAPMAAVPLDLRALTNMTVFEPVRSAGVLSRALQPYLPLVMGFLRWWAPLALLVWTLCSTAGRVAMLKRVSGELQPHFRFFLVNRLLRAGAFVVLLLLWLRLLRSALQATILTSGSRGSEPNLVLFTAEAVALTLAAFLLWSLLIWSLDLAPLRLMTGLQPTPAQGRELRSKVIEINLVMGIVRVALLVLALTFSASPLPFQNQQTQAFIDLWWAGVVLLYLMGSDFFHVVRCVIYLRLLQSIASRANAAPPHAS